MPRVVRKHGLGAKLSPVDVRDYKFDKKCMAINYPETFECSKRTAIKDQGSVGSCVAHSMAEILEYHNEELKMSTNFIYGIHHKLYGTTGPGMYVRSALKISQKYGDPEYTYCVGNTEVDKVYELAERAFGNPKAMENAKEHRISSYAKVSSMDSIKYALTRYGPVIACIPWYSGNKVNPLGQLMQGLSMDGYHAIVIRG